MKTAVLINSYSIPKCILSLFLLVSFIAGIDSFGQAPKTKAAKSGSSLNTLSTQTDIEVFAIRLLETETKAQPQHLKTKFAPLTRPNDPNNGLQDIPRERVVLLPGVSFYIKSIEIGQQIMHKLRPEIEPKGYRLFLCPDEGLFEFKIAIIRSDDEFTPLVYMQTKAVSSGLTTHSLIAQLDSLNESLDLKLIGADSDWCEFEIRKEPKDWNFVAERIMKIYPRMFEPDKVTVKDFAELLKKKKNLFFWFD